MERPLLKQNVLNLALMLLSLTILSLGLLMIFSTTSAGILDHDLGKNTHLAFLKQVYYCLAGFFLSVLIFKIGYQKILSFAPICLTVFIVLLIFTLIPGIGKEVNGSRRWLSFMGLSFQPSEFVKYLVPAYFIKRFLDYPEGTFSFTAFLKLSVQVALPIFLILVEPNNGTALVIGMTLLVLLILLKVPFRYWGSVLFPLIAIGGIFALQLPYVSARLSAYIHPETDLKGKGHQPHQAKIAAGSGGLFGKGPGNGLQKLSYLPEAQNDYIAAIFAEEFGFLGIFCLILLYMLLAYIGFSISFQAEDLSGFYLGASVTFLISLQAFLNLGVVSGLLPSTGLNLPFFSQGGTSLMASMVGLAILLSIGKR